ncbi:MAG: ATP-dependent RNA helicase HrpA [Acidimicrobiales bacterium]|nr:ATP-dependent RNA helicase HrpA [Acidimicrobiales bacterium]
MPSPTDDARLERRRALLPRPRYPDLPVVAHREALLTAIRDHQVIVVAGETGSGKSTQLPKLCLELGLGAAGLIGHTQPRRLAARAVSERIAEELDTEIGQAVGYTVRFNDRVGDDTFIKVMTDGILLAEIQRDRMLRAYEVLIIDEAHERSLNIDFLLGYLHQLLPQRPDLKVIITSATIDTERFAAHFRGAPVVEVSGRSFPVEVRYRPIGEEPGDRRDQTQAITDAVQELVRDGPGDILVFLSGEREIRDTAEALARADLHGTDLLPLYARLSATDQHRVFAPHRGRRVVLATNVAETSLTVPGIVGVVDPGTARISRFNRRTKVQRLPIEPISQASANQRAGRCGRVAPGTCIRLYAEEDFAARPEFTEPEILRTNLASVILQMAALGLGDVTAFPFVEPPDARAIRDGILLLEELGAIARGTTGDHVQLTKLGRRLSRLPVDPRLGRMVLEADRHGVVAEVLVLAAGMSIQDPRERPADHQQTAREHHKRFEDPTSDFLGYLNLWRYLRAQQKELGSSQFRRMCQREHLHHLRVREWQDVHVQLRQAARGIGLDVRPLADDPDRDGIHTALLAGLLSHVGMLDVEGGEYRGAREARFTLANGSALGKRRPKWVVAGELVETDRLRARTVAQVQPHQIERVAGHLVTRHHEEPWWDQDRGAAVTNERVSLYGLPIVTARCVGYERIDPVEARAMLIRHALVDGDWHSHHAFVQANKEQVAEVLALEDRVRRDLLVDDDALWAFFDARVPSDVTTARRFDRWWKQAQRAQPDLLAYGPEDLLDPNDGPIDLAGFPDTWVVDGLALPLAYVRNPSSDLDGVTVDVPLPLLDRLEGAGLDWQVPGRRPELVVALLRTLPKALRRHASPAPDVARELLARVGPEDGPLLDVLARAVALRSGEPFRARSFHLDDVPGHLRITIRATDAAGRPVAWSKDLPALRRRLRDRIREAVAAAAPLPEQGNLRRWPDGDLPRTVETHHAGVVVTAFPALADEGDAVAVRILPTESEQRTAMWAGTRRLLLLHLGSPLRTLDRSLTNPTKVALAASAHVTAAEVYVDAATAAVDHLLLRAGGPVWTRAEFDTLAATVRSHFAATAAEVAGQVGQAVATVNRVEARLSTMLSANLDETVVDVQAHIRRLLHRGWITAAGTDHLPDVVRYLAGIEHRLDKAAAQPDRDRARLRALQKLEREYRSVAPRDVDGRVRWMLEELRVSTFAQKVGVKGGASEPKVRSELARLLT